MISSESVLLEVNRLSSGGYNAGYFPNPEQISRYKEFEIIYLDPRTLSFSSDHLHQTVVDHYARLNTDFPPIVLDQDGKVIDGFQRVGAAQRRGEDTIKAYRAIY